MGPGQFLNPSSGLGVEGKVSSAWLEAENAQLCRMTRYRVLSPLRDLLGTAWKAPRTYSHRGFPKFPFFRCFVPSEGF